MNAVMMPKIADFGLSRIFGSQQSRINTKSRTGSLGYMAPEYSIQGIISMKADIFSLGVIIVEIVTGRRDYPLNMLPYFQLDSPHDTDISFQHYIGKVVECWTSKFVSTLEYKPMEKYTHQVKQCITIALQCVDPVMARRPSADDIIQFFNAIEQMETHEKLPLSEQCTSSQNYQEAVNTSNAPQAVGSGRATEPRESTSNPTSSYKSKRVSSLYVFNTKCKVVTGAIRHCYSPGEAATIVFEDVYRAAYEMVRHNDGKELYSVVESTMASEVQVLGSALGNFYGALLLREILAKWRWHMKAVRLIGGLLAYLEKMFVETTGRTTIYELGLGLWRDLVVHSPEVRPWLIEAVRQERGTADVAVPAGDLKEGVNEMLEKLGDELHHEVMDAPPLEE